MTQAVLHLSAANIDACAPQVDETRNAIGEAFAALKYGKAKSPPKQTITLEPGHSFQCLMSAWQEKGIAAVKWIGVAPVFGGSKNAGINASIILSDYDSGLPLAVMDGNVVTAIRTAAMSAFAAQKLARQEARQIGVIGCGLQARHHINALKAVLPSLKTVVAFSRSPVSTAAFVEYVRLQGLEARATLNPSEAVIQSDVIITTVPMSRGFVPFLDPAWIPRGAFVSAVDIGRSWLPHHLRALDILATADHQQQADSPPLAPDVGHLGTFDADLADLATSTHPGRTHDSQRAMFIFRGLGLADLAVAGLVYKKAISHNVGNFLNV